MKFSLDQKKVELAFLLIIIALLLFVGIGNVYKNQIVHSFPYGYSAGDSYIRMAYAEGALDQGHFRTYAPYIVNGYDDVITVDPPILDHIAPLFAKLSGLKIYDAILLLVFIIGVMSALLTYLIIRDFNQNVAYLAMPVTVLYFIGTFLVSFTWGNWTSIVATFFLLAMVWTLNRFDSKHMWILTGIFFAGSVLTHTPEAIFGGMYLVAWIAARKFITKDLSMDLVKRLAYALVLAAVLAINYLIIFKFLWLPFNPYQFGIVKASDYHDIIVVTITTLGWIMPVIAIGMVLGAFFLKKPKNQAILFGLFMFLVGFTNYVGFGRRAFQARFHWPLVLAVFFGIVLYFALKKFMKSWKQSYSVGLSLIILIAILFLSYNSVPVGGYFDQQQMQGINYLRDRTDQDAKVYYLYSDCCTFQGGVPFISKRLSWTANFEDLADGFQKGIIKHAYKSNLIYEGVTHFPTRTGLFSFGHHTYNDTLMYQVPKDLCGFDYYYLGKAGRVPELAQYNVAIANQLLKTGWFKNVFENDEIVILRNERPGAECIATVNPNN